MSTLNMIAKNGYPGTSAFPLDHTYNNKERSVQGGLSKLDYTAIHIYSGAKAAGLFPSPDSVIKDAKELLEALEKEQF